MKGLAEIEWVLDLAAKQADAPPSDYVRKPYLSKKAIIAIRAIREGIANINARPNSYAYSIDSSDMTDTLSVGMKWVCTVGGIGQGSRVHQCRFLLWPKEITPQVSHDCHRWADWGYRQADFGPDKVNVKGIHQFQMLMAIHGDSEGGL